MHIAQFLGNLSLRVHVEIIGASLPEVPSRCPFPKVALRFFPFRQQAISHALLQHLYRNGKSFAPRLANQDVNVLGHYHESDHIESVASSYLLEYLKKDVAGASASKQSFAPIAARRNEVKIAATVVPQKSLGHGSGLYKTKT